MNKKIELFFKRALRRHKRNIEDIGGNTEKTIDKHFFRRLHHLKNVRRQMAGWLILIALVILVGFLQFGALREKYLPEKFVSGGIFTEGIVGSYTNSNPIYSSTSSVDSSVSELLYAGLFNYDAEGKLTPDLAESITLSSDNKTYTVALKSDLYWHDGTPLTAKDVVFTFNTIKNPDAESFLAPGWQGIRVEAVDDYTIRFELDNALGPFPHSLTIGILPEHILGSLPADQLRASDFNTVNAVGSGPFRIGKVEVNDASSETKTQTIGLLPFEKYHKGKPALSRYIIKTFDSQENLKKAFTAGEITAASDVSSVFDDQGTDSDNNFIPVNLTAQTMVFFKNSEGLLADTKVRRALTLGVNKQEIITATGDPLHPIDSPMLNPHFAYSKKVTQKTNNPSEAKKVLNKAGWKPQADGTRMKKKTRLSFNLYVNDSNEHQAVAEKLKEQWREIGAEVNVVIESEENRQSTIATHSYDALLNSISVGADPDVYAFWHSSQFDPRLKTRLNFSEYKSKDADASLEGGRSRTDPKLRTVKYQPFLKAWTTDNPAVALYRPQFVFLVSGELDGFTVKNMVNISDKYVNIENWKIRKER
ncbi:MAG TPA: peptide ABC transporter substrate-binding protein [Candidatus Saccharimonadales bacterium]|nr:peptide ABC transporter substrate-binding protein [Candidatus Saccharimonadales bacterium]